MLVLVLIVLAFCVWLFPVFRCIVLNPWFVAYYGITDLVKYVRFRSWNDAPYGQITCYIADSSTSFGCGKTLSCTNYIVSLFNQFDGQIGRAHV